jgi:hypothetical protein
MVKELEILKIIVPDEFLVGGIIAKLPPSWRDFTTTLKHKKTHMSISDLIMYLDVEEKTQTKDGRSKEFEGQTSANMVNQLQSHGKCDTPSVTIAATMPLQYPHHASTIFNQYKYGWSLKFIVQILSLYFLKSSQRHLCRNFKILHTSMTI